MATPAEKLAESLEVLHTLQEKGTVAIRSADLTRTHRERLRDNGFLKEVVKGWYIASHPEEAPGESTTWYAAYWPFCAAYIGSRKADRWCLSPEQSLSLHAENWTVPRQLLIRSEEARNNPLALPHGTSLLDIRAALPPEAEVVKENGLRLYSLPAALVACSPSYFRQQPTDLRAALSMVRDASDVLSRLLEGGHSTVAGRLAGAFRNIGRTRIADDILDTMRAAGYTVREADPFDAPSAITFASREPSPYVSRIRLMWETMRKPILDRFPEAPGIPADPAAYLRRIEEIYVTDAYHSLSIEGYRVNRELIERVRSGNWSPERNEEDRNHRNALAARGYWQAYQEVRKAVERTLTRENPGAIADEVHGTWYREMFGPSVTAGILRPADLAGYRNGPVYIRQSMHVPPSSEAVRDAMPAFFELLREETDPGVSAVLGHFVFVYIHPYTDGNGRMARFLMNMLLGSGGYPWTIIPVDERATYMAALEHASVDQDIAPFADFLGELVSRGMNSEGEQVEGANDE